MHRIAGGDLGREFLVSRPEGFGEGKKTEGELLELLRGYTLGGKKREVKKGGARRPLGRDGAKNTVGIVLCGAVVVLYSGAVLWWTFRRELGMAQRDRYANLSSREERREIDSEQ